MRCREVLQMTGVAAVLLAGSLAAHGAPLRSLHDLDLFGTGDYTVDIAGNNFQGRVDHDSTHGWLLLGRGRQGWEFDADGQGAIGDVYQNLGTPAAFAPKAYSNTLINDLITDAGTNMTGVEVRLRRAANPYGSEYQEVRWRDFTGNGGAWTWDFDGPLPSGPSPYGVTVERVNDPTGLPGATVGTNTGGNTRDFLPTGNDGDRVFTWPWSGHGSQQGFSYGSSVTDGANTAASFLWESGNENHAIPYTEVYVRVENPTLPGTINVGGESAFGTDTLPSTQGNEAFGPLTGAKYVRVVQNVGDTLQVGELQIFDTGNTNVAPAGTATSKDTGFGGVPSRANDGNTNMAWSGGSVFHSGSGRDTWLQIELAGTTDLNSVHFWGRSDCCQGRQGDFNLVVEDASHSTLFDKQIVGLGSTSPYHGNIPVDMLVSADLTATLLDTSTYLFEVGSGNDQLTISNPDPNIFSTILDLNNATIEVQTLGPLSPGQVFKLFDFDSITGSYDQIVLPAYVWDTSDLLSGGTLQFIAIPEPTTLLIWSLLAGLGVGLRWRRRK